MGDPFCLFWPIATSGDFFGQWNNIFMWSAVALAVAPMPCSGKPNDCGHQPMKAVHCRDDYSGINISGIILTLMR